MSKSLPISIIVATANRPTVLLRTLKSFNEQSSTPDELLIIDASYDESTAAIVKEMSHRLKSKLVYQKAHEMGAAKQRNQGLEIATYDVVGFMDDDIIFEQHCFEYLWEVLCKDKQIGGVSAFITNQHFTKPGLVSKFVFGMMSGFRISSFGGKVFGPVINILPEQDQDQGKEVRVDWLNTTLTLYRKMSLPQPVFDPHFTGYSFMEDVALSLKVAKDWHLYNVQKARIFHDSQGGVDKDRKAVLAEMEIVNRHYIMTKVVGYTGFVANLKFILYQIFTMVVTGNTFNGEFWSGKLRGVRRILRTK